MLENEVKTRLLQEILQHVPFDGWQNSTLNKAAQIVGISPVTVDMLFPEGIVDMIDFFHETADQQMVEAVKALPLDAMKIREKVAVAIRLRLEQGAAHRAAIRRALVVYALPQHAMRAARSVWRTADSIWYAIGDSSTNHSYYTKRLMLGGVYSATVLFWLDDVSEGHQETWQFLSRRIENVMQFGKLTSSFVKKFSFNASK